MTRLRKRDHDYLVCTAANAKAGCKYQTLRLEHVREALTSNAQRIHEQAPRGRDAEAYEDRIEELDLEIDHLSDVGGDLMDEWLATKNAIVRGRLDQVDEQLNEAKRQLQEAQELRAKAASPFVPERLDALRSALLSDPLDIVTANRALREAASKIVVHPEAGELEIHWHHGGVTQAIRVQSRHHTPFEPEEGGYRYVPPSKRKSQRKTASGSADP
jgi:hypothetical protein